MRSRVLTAAPAPGPSLVAPPALTPAQAAALRRAHELAAELPELTATIRGILRAERAAEPSPLAAEPPAEAAPAAEGSGLATGELGAAFAAANRASRRRPRELFGR